MLRHAETAQQLDELSMYGHLLFGKDKQTQLYEPTRTMVSVSTVQPSINLEFLCTYKNLKMSLYTLC